MGGRLRLAISGCAAALFAACTVLVLPAVPADAAPFCQVNHGETICTFSYNGTTGVNGSVQTWVVPANVTTVTIEAWGAQGGHCSETACVVGEDSWGGRGGQVGTQLPVTPGEILNVRVGGVATSSIAGGYNGGGDGAQFSTGSGWARSGGGGGASDVRQGGDGLAHRVVVAGGGGGKGRDQLLTAGGGAGGGAAGASGLCYTAGGIGNACTPSSTAKAGTGGTSTGGGAVGGALGVGGPAQGLVGAGGGGGLYGGGGSEAGATDGSAGGGGGSGFVPGGCATPLYGGVCTTGVRSGQGEVKIRYQPALPGAPTVTKVLPNDSAATVTWTAPTDTGNTTLTGYVITPYLGGVAQPSSSFNASRTSQKVLGLTNGSTYTFRVAAVNSVGTGAQSADSDPLIVGTPSPPGFQGAAPGNNSAKVQWTTPAANGSPITGYQITPYVGSTPGTPQAFPAASTSVVVTGLTNGTTYTFAVQAINAFGAGASAITAPIVVGAPTAPVFPNAAPGNGTARVGWAASAPNGAPVTGYTITPFIGTTAGTPISFGTATLQTITGLTNGTTYTFRVTATNALGTSPASVTPAIKVGTPAAPGYLSAGPGDASATVRFFTPAANAAPIQSYTVTPYVGTTPGTPQVFATPAATVLTVAGLTNGTSYTFRVHANNAIGAGPDAITTAITVGAPAAPVFPGAAPGNASAKVAWQVPNANGSPITGYVITPVLGSTALAPQTFASTATSQIVTGLTNGSTYTFRVAATNAVGTGPFSTTTAIKVGTPTAPGFPRASSLGSTSAKVAWNASTANGSAITSYIVTPMIGTVAQTPRVFSPSATSQTITGLTPGTTYTFRVAAANSVGTGPYGTTGSVTTGP